jgi:hypothetical protein
MTSRSNPDWLAELIAEEGDSKPIDVHERDELMVALGAAQAPKAIDSDRHQRILRQALGQAPAHVSLSDNDILAPPSPDEQAAATRLQDTLDSDPLVIALRSAHHPSSLRKRAEHSLRKVALAKHSTQPRLLSRHLSASVWGSFAVAAAAALWLAVRTHGGNDGIVNAPQGRSTLALSRSTESLFVKPFTLSTNSERIDKIAQVRSRELRNNRYAIWGLP